MNPEEIRKLEARDKLILANMRLVYSAVNHYLGRGVDRDDLVQEGMRGLIRAAGSHDESRTAFSTHATNWILHYVRLAVSQMGGSVRTPYHAYRLLTVYRRRLDQMANESGPPTPEAVMDDLGLEPGERISLVAAMRCRDEPFRIDLHPGLTRETIAGQGGLVTDPADVAVADDEEFEQRLQDVMGILSGLKPKYRDVIRMRFGIEYDRPYRQREVAEALGMTRCAVDNNRSMAIKKLKERAGVA